MFDFYISKVSCKIEGKNIMAGINGFNGYYNYYNPQFNFKSANNAFQQADIYSKLPQFVAQPQTTPQYTAQQQTTPEKSDAESTNYLKIGGGLVGLALLGYGLYKGRNLLKSAGNKAAQTPHNPHPAPKTPQTPAAGGEKPVVQITEHAPAPSVNQTAEKTATQAAGTVDDAAKAANKADDAAKAAKEAEAKAQKEAAEKAAKEAEAKAAKEAEEKAAKEAAKKAQKELQDKYTAEMDVTARQKLQEINEAWASRLDAFAGIKLCVERNGFQRLGKNMERLENGTYKITSTPKNGVHYEYYSHDGQTLDEIIVINNGQKRHEIGFRDKGKTGDLTHYNENGKPEYSIDFIINGKQGERFASWTNIARKFDEEGLTSIYCDFAEGKFQWNALPPETVANGFALTNWAKI